MKRVLVICALLALAPASVTMADDGGYYGSGHRSDCGGQPCTGTSTTTVGTDGDSVESAHPFLDFLRSLFSFDAGIDINDPSRPMFGGSVES